MKDSLEWARSIAKELHAKGEHILTVIANKKERAYQGMIHYIIRESFHGGNMGLNEFDRVRVDRGKVDVVPLGFVLREDNGTAVITEGHENTETLLVRIT